MPARVLTVYGTRPEAIKLAPVIGALEADSRFHSIIAVTGQHREMLDQVNSLFGIVPNYDLNVFAPAQELNLLMAKVFRDLDPILQEVRPDAVVVQGDTSTVAAAAIAAFYRNIPVIHLEAGLRSGDIRSPFPEEANRKITSQVASLHLAPTNSSRRNLEQEGFTKESIVVTGNTVIDALIHTVAENRPYSEPRLAALEATGRPIILVTMHRRENWGGAMEGVGRALKEIANAQPGHVIVLPIHKNPVVRESVLPYIQGLENVLVLEPLAYTDFTRLLNAAHLVLTDSGGVQEEAPSLGKPVLVMRDNTERPEAIRAGTAKLVGTDEKRIVTVVTELINDREAYSKMASAINPYGDGHAARRALAALAELLRIGDRVADFA